MIVDVHTHLPRYKRRAKDESLNELREKELREKILRFQGPCWDRLVKPFRGSSWEDHYEAMRVVDKAIVFGIARVGEEVNVNDEVAEYVSMHPEKMIGFMSVDPNDPGCVEEIRRCFTELKLKGIKLGPIYQSFHPQSEKAAAVYREAEKLGLPIMFHQATTAYHSNLLEIAQPLLLEKIAHSYPDLKIIYAHMGHPWWRDVVLIIRRNSNMYADVSALFYHPWDFYNAMEFAYEWNQIDKLLLGSDYPDAATPEQTIEALRNVNKIVEGTNLPKIPEETIEGIINRDSLEILGID